MSQIPTSSQTVGPFFSIGLARLCEENFAARETPGEHLTIEGSIVDGDGQPVPDALLEIWQADAQGEYAGAADAPPGQSSFRGFGRVATDELGRFRFTTVKPGCVLDTGGGVHAPHLVIAIFMRGLLTQLVTRIYFPDEPRNAEDAVLRLVPRERRDTLLAKASTQNAGLFVWNVILQGPGETVFFAC